MLESKASRHGLKLASGLVALLGLALLAWACEEGEKDLFIVETVTPFLRSPEAVGSPTVTVTPAIAETPPVTATPTPAVAETPTPTEEGSPVAAQVTPVTPFEVTVSEANTGLRIREMPTTNAAILGAIYWGDKKKVIGEALGQEAEPGKGNLWYALEGGGFVYAPLVEKVEGTPRAPAAEQ